MFALEIKASFLLSTHVGVQVEQTDHSTKIYEKKYCEEIIQRYNFGNAKNSDGNKHSFNWGGYRCGSYQELLGSLIYPATRIRPDIALSVEQLSRPTCRIPLRSTSVLPQGYSDT